jgi:hypothetical protein
MRKVDSGSKTNAGWFVGVIWATTNSKLVQTVVKQSTLGTKNAAVPVSQQDIVVVYKSHGAVHVTSALLTGLKLHSRAV